MYHIRGNAQWSSDQLHVIIQCDKEMSIIDVCRKVARERNASENSVTICAKNESSEQRVCRSSTRTHTGTRTMLPDTNLDEHWHTAFSNFHLPFHLQFVTLDFVLSDRAASDQGPGHRTVTYGVVAARRPPVWENNQHPHVPQPLLHLVRRLRASLALYCPARNPF